MSSCRALCCTLCRHESTGRRGTFNCESHRIAKDEKENDSSSWMRSRGWAVNFILTPSESQLSLPLCSPTSYSPDFFWCYRVLLGKQKRLQFGTLFLTCLLASLCCSCAVCSSSRSASSSCLGKEELSIFYQKTRKETRRRSFVQRTDKM